MSYIFRVFEAIKNAVLDDIDESYNIDTELEDIALHEESNCVHDDQQTDEPADEQNCMSNEMPSEVPTCVSSQNACYTTVKQLEERVSSLDNAVAELFLRVKCLEEILANKIS